MTRAEWSEQNAKRLVSDLAPAYANEGDLKIAMQFARDAMAFADQNPVDAHQPVNMAEVPATGQPVTVGERTHPTPAPRVREALKAAIEWIEAVRHHKNGWEYLCDAQPLSCREFGLDGIKAALDATNHGGPDGV